MSAAVEQPEVGVVGEVEEIGTQFHRDPFPHRNPEGPAKGDIAADIRVADTLVATDVAADGLEVHRIACRSVYEG